MPRRQRLPRRSKDVRVGLLTRVSLVTYSVAAAVSKGRLHVIAANNPDSCRIAGADAALTRHGSALEPHGGRKNDEKQSRELRVGLLARVSLVARGSYSTPTSTSTLTRRRLRLRHRPRSRVVSSSTAACRSTSMAFWAMLTHRCPKIALRPASTAAKSEEACVGLLARVSSGTYSVARRGDGACPRGHVRWSSSMTACRSMGAAFWASAPIAGYAALARPGIVLE